jgi:hypothetical protein
MPVLLDATAGEGTTITTASSTAATASPLDTSNYLGATPSSAATATATVNSSSWPLRSVAQPPVTPATLAVVSSG